MPDGAPHAGPVAGTIVARNYLPAARVLAASYRRHHPQAPPFTVLVVDGEPGDESEGLRLLGPRDLDLDAGEFARMAMAYSVTELCTAVKPWLLRRLLAEHATAIYLDPDIEVFAPFGDEVGRLAAEHAIVLTPHVTAPMPRDGLRPSEADIMASGVFNLGFIGVSRDAEPFLAFWAERLRTDAISSVTEQLFTDQRWVDNVPALFRHTVITDPGYNVAFWNVHERPLASEGGRLTAGGEPVRFYHYSGYRPERPWLASTHYSDRPRVLLSERPVLAELLAGYRRRLTDAGYAEALEDVPYRWDRLADGCRVSPALRRAFRREWIDAERRGATPPPSPFTGRAGAAEEFLRWATEPATPEQERAGLHRWALAVWTSRLDLRAAFPDPLGADAARFREWCATSGVAEGELDARAVPSLDTAEPVPVRNTLGANVLGYLTAELGVGELGRLVHESVLASGLPVATAVEEQTVVSRTGHPLPDGVRAGLPEYPVSVLCVNADMTRVTLRAHPDLARDRYVIGVWSWELATFPPAMREAFELVDEVWTISRFCADAIAEQSPVPVHTFPVPVRPMPPADPAGGPLVFLFVFDHNSVFERKNPLAAVTAFTRAFEGRDDVRLVIKSINGDRHPGDRERLRAAVAGDERIELIERYLDADEVRKLFASAGCYLSLHRSEGFGLTIAEAMAHGLPVIATAYSGSSELLTAETGWPVPYRLVPVGRGNAPYPPDALWAEPDLDAAVAALREVASDRREAARRGAAARAHVLAARPAAAATAWVRERLEEAYRRWQARACAPSSEPAAVMAVRDAREALRWRADAGAPSRNPLAPALRRAVLRAVDHYDHHQRTVLGALMDGVEQGIGRLAELHAQLTERVERLEHGLSREQAELAALAERTTGHHEQLHATLTRAIEAAAAELDAASRARDEELSAALSASSASLSAEVAAAGEATTAAAAQRVDELDHKLVALLAERDERLGRAEHAAADLRRDLGRELPALRAAVLRHHEVLHPPSALGVPSEAVATDVGVLRLPAGDTVVLPWLRAYGTWEPDESRLLDALLPAGGVLVDIGAHVGYFTVRALARGAAVYAVEPWPVARELLAANAAANVAGTPALTVLPVAAWDADGPLRLALSADGNSGDNRIDPGGTLDVDGARLDGVPALLAAPRIDVIKSDAQGRDHRALAGAAGLLARHRPHVLCEFDPAAIGQAGDDPLAVLRRYRSWGYLPLPVSASLVDGVEGARDGRLPSGVDVPSDGELVEIAGSAPGGFVTLWLRPADEPAGALGADGG